MANTIKNWQKYGYFYGTEGMPEKSALKIMCQRRADEVADICGSQLSYSEMLGRVYYQGLKDAADIFRDSQEKITP